MPTPPAIEAFLQKALPRLRADHRLVGVAAGGSWVGDGMDEHSDLDLILVTQDDSFAEVMQERTKLAESLHPLLAAFTGEHVGEPRLLICLYGPPLLHVDLKFVALEDFGLRTENPEVLWERDSALSVILKSTKSHWPRAKLQWIEDRFWVWIHYAASKLARGELFEVLDMLGFLRAQVPGPLVAQAQAHPPQGVRRLETRAAKWVPAMKQTVAAYNARSCGAALQAAVKVYQKLRGRYPGSELVRRVAAEEAVLRYLASVVSRQSRRPAPR